MTLLGLYRFYKFFSLVLVQGSAGDFGAVFMYVMMPLIPGVLLMLAGRYMKRSAAASAGLSGARISGPNGETLTVPTEQANQCGFCGTVMPAFATVCSSCGAQKGIGKVGKFGVVGPGAVLPMRIFAASGWFLVLVFFLAWGNGGAPYAVFGTLIMFALTMFNYRTIFWNGTYLWYR